MAKKDNVVEPDFTNEDFVVPASDNEGHNVPFRMRIMPAHSRQIQNIVASKKFPAFKNASDVVRWCLHAGLRRLAKMPGIKSVIGQAQIIIDTLKEDTADALFVTVFDMLDKKVYENQSKGTLSHAVKLILQTKRNIEDMPDGHWKEQYLKMFEEKYGKYLDSAKKASFKDFAEE